MDDEDGCLLRSLGSLNFMADSREGGQECCKPQRNVGPLVSKS